MSASAFSQDTSFKIAKILKKKMRTVIIFFAKLFLFNKFIAFDNQQQSALV